MAKLSSCFLTCRCATLPHIYLKTQILSADNRTNCLFLFHTEIISAEFFWENAVFGGRLQIDAKNSEFEVLIESTLYMRLCRSMPLKFIYSFLSPVTHQCSSFVPLSFAVHDNQLWFRE